MSTRTKAVHHVGPYTITVTGGASEQDEHEARIAKEGRAVHRITAASWHKADLAALAWVREHEDAPALLAAAIEYLGRSYWQQESRQAARAANLVALEIHHRAGKWAHIGDATFIIGWLERGVSCTFQGATIESLVAEWQAYDAA